MSRTEMEAHYPLMVVDKIYQVGRIIGTEKKLQDLAKNPRLSFYLPCGVDNYELSAEQVLKGLQHCFYGLCMEFNDLGYPDLTTSFLETRAKVQDGTFEK